jgi:hypothetical protein
MAVLASTLTGLEPTPKATQESIHASDSAIGTIRATRPRRMLGTPIPCV